MTTPTKIHQLRGFPGHRTYPAEPEPASISTMPPPPEFLNGPAREEWFRLGAELARLGVLTIADLSPFAAYCQAYGRWCVAETAITKLTEAELTSPGSKKGLRIVNPLFVLARRAAADMITYAGQFGATPVARRRVATGPTDTTQKKFSGLLGNG